MKGFGYQKFFKITDFVFRIRNKVRNLEQHEVEYMLQIFYLFIYLFFTGLSRQIFADLYWLRKCTVIKA